VEVTFTNKTKICICTVYRVGTLGLENLSILDTYFKTLLRTKKYSKLFIIGDFNLPNITLANWETGNCDLPLEQSFLNLFDSIGVTQLVNDPTHEKGNVLDLVLTNSPQSLSSLTIESENSFCSSDHMPISFNIKANVRRKKVIKRKILNFKKANWDALNHDLQETDWNTLLSSSDIEICWDKFVNKLDSLCNKHIPTITIKSSFKPPWFDSEVFGLCRTKEKWRKKFKQTKSLDHGIKFKTTRKQVKQLIRSKMNSNFSDEHSTNSITKKFWSYVKSTTNSHRIPEMVNLNGTHRATPEGQADLFNDFFFRQFSSPSHYDIGIDYNLNSSDISFNLSSISGFLQKLDPNKCPGPDGIHGMVLKRCATNIALPLQILFRTSYYTYKIATAWKLAHIVPVHKKGSKNSVENYRPISLTSLIMKIYERVVRDELMKLVRHKINDIQHGFLPRKSCQSNLIPFYDNLACSLNKGSRTDVIYFDFSKAFDSVNHDIILQKLKYNFGINGFLLKFFVEYLRDRLQKVVVGGVVSGSQKVLSGVPQGSILGPLLFILFINDIGDDLSEGSTISLYADDTKLTREINYDSDHILLQKDITMLHNWAITNKMRFHPDKCKALTVSLQRKRSSSPFASLPLFEFFYHLGDIMINFVKSEKDLGVYINSSLTWTEHCNYLYSKANRNFGLMRRTCNFITNPRQRRSLYIAMIRSLFEHCSSVWSPSSTVTLNKLESIQRKSIKWILGEDYQHYSEITYYLRCKELDLLPIKYRLVFNDLKLLHNILYSRSVINLPDYIHFHNGYTRLRSSHLDNLSLVSDLTPKLSNNYSKNTESVASSLSQFSNSFFYRSMNSWNSLPFDTRSVSDPPEFETSLLKDLWTLARPQTP
jgi:hypothetical protein